MMKRKTCPICQRPLSVCICHKIKEIDNLWPIWILQDSTEKKHAIGTAKIANLSLSQCNTFTAEYAQCNETLTSSIESLAPVLVYPGDDVLTLDELAVEATRPLLFLDGTWRKTKKMFYEIPILKDMPRLSINPDSISRYRIRKTPNDSAISTLEAIVYVLSKLENDTEKYQPMLEAMDWMIEKQIEYMGEATFRKNY